MNDDGDLKLPASLFLAMSRRRVSSSLMIQQLWDAVKIIRYKRQSADFERIQKYMRMHKTSDEELKRQLGYAVRDGLLKIHKKVVSKGENVGTSHEAYILPDEKAPKDGHDWYCFACHSSGDVICCTTCHRVYHLSCLSAEDVPKDDVRESFVCKVCQAISKNENTPTIKRSQLNRLLKYIASRLKDRLPVALTDRTVPSGSSYISERFAKQSQVTKPSIDVPLNFQWMLTDKDEWRIDYLIYRSIDLHEMEKKADNKGYTHLEEFRADVQNIVHNVVIYHGVNSNMADTARLILRDCTNDLREILECWYCYKYSNNRAIRNWFCKPCDPPHELVYARTEGNPYWPAKVMKKTGDEYEVRFFGPPHERAVVRTEFTRSISFNIHSLQGKRTSSWNKASDELNRYQKQLEKRRQATEDFTKPYISDGSSSSDSESDDDEPLKSPAKPPVVNKSTGSGSNKANDSKVAASYLQPAASKIENEAPKLTEEQETPKIKYDEEDSVPTLKRNRGRQAKAETPASTRKKKKPSDEPASKENSPVSNSEQRSTKKESAPTLTSAERRRKKEISPVSPDKEPIKKKETSPTRPNSEPRTRRKDNSPVISIASPRLKKKEVSPVLPNYDRPRRNATRVVNSKPKRYSESNNNVDGEHSEDVAKPELKAAKSAPVVNGRIGSNALDEDISSTSGKVKTSPKKTDEDVDLVTSSSSHPVVNGTSTRSVKVQTKPTSDNSKPSKEFIAKMKEAFDEEKEQLIEQLKREHERELEMIRAAHATLLLETKRKQWCVNCEGEAMYHCCWNTSYCSHDCQLAHWAAEHKRHCRRKREHDNVNNLKSE